MANEFKNLTELRQLLKDFRWYHELYLQFFPGARVVKDRLLVHCPIPSHGHSGRGQAGLSIDLTRGLFHCFSRDDGGDIFKFYMLMYGISFAEAIRRPRNLMVGTPAMIADSMQDLFESEACDGFVLTPTISPLMWEEFARMLTPELQRRGLLRIEYTGATTRENLRS